MVAWAFLLKWEAGGEKRGMRLESCPLSDIENAVRFLIAWTKIHKQALYKEKPDWPTIRENILNPISYGSTN